MTIHTGAPTHVWYNSMERVEEIIARGHAKRAAMEAQAALCKPTIDVPHKPCNHCGKPKPLTAFYTHSTTRDGREGRCKVCKAKYDRERIARLRRAANGG